MALGFKEAKQNGPLPKVEFAPGQDVENVFPADQVDQPTTKVIPFTMPRANEIVGPTDPLLGPTGPDDMSGLVLTNNSILAALEKILIATRAAHPTTTLSIVGNPRIAAGSSEVYKFQMGGRPVPALAFYIQNNSGGDIFINFDGPGTGTGIKIATGTDKVFSFADINAVGIWSAAAIVVNGLVNTEVQQAVGVVIEAWGNSEWSNVWGMAS
jgi:hypothetical protein